MIRCEVREDLLRPYSEAAEKLVPLSKELANIAISYEADMFVRIWDRFTHAKDFCEHARRELSKLMACLTDACKLSPAHDTITAFWHRRDFSSPALSYYACNRTQRFSSPPNS